MKKFVIQFILLLLVIGIGFYFSRPGGSDISLPFLPASVTSGTVLVGPNVFKVEIADTQSKRSKGLGGRNSLAPGGGMLFVFDRADKYSFWMKGVKFPLDFIYIKEEKVVDIIQNVVPPGNGIKDENLPIFVPKEEADKVLEVAAGTVKSLNIKEGDEFKLQ